MIGSGLGLLYPQAVRIIIDDALDRDLELIKNAALGLIASSHYRRSNRPARLPLHYRR